MIIWPNKDRSLPISITASPVTHTPDVAVKRASINGRRVPVVETESERRIVPIIMVVAKLRTKILIGDKKLKIKSLIL